MIDIFVDTQKDSVSDEFYAYQVPFEKEIFWGDTLTEIQEKIREAYMDGLPADSGYTAEDLSNLIKNITLEELLKVTVTFSKPSFNVNTAILENSFSTDERGESKLDFIKYTRNRLYTLLKEWSFEQDGKMVPVTPENISRLHPSLVEGIISKLNKNIKHYKAI